MKELLDPIQLYKSELKDVFNDKAVKLFDDITKKSGVNIEENKKTMSQLKAEKQKLDNVNDELKSHRTKKGLSITGTILCFIGAIASIYALSQNKLETAPAVIVALVLIAIAILLIVVASKETKKIRTLSDQASVHEKKINEFINLGYTQLANLNANFDYNYAHKIINETLQIIHLDNYFEPSRFVQLQQRYGFVDYNHKDQSILMVKSGTILGNPFMLYKDLKMTMGTQTYTGSITIHWTTTYTDSNGHLQTQHHTETLYASVTKPKPFYSTFTKLVYGNDAAPNLSFSRGPTNVSSMNDKERDRYLKKYDKKLDKMVQKDIDPSDGSQFTRLHNTEFEAAFNALDRDNEVEFRLLFTPLAQTSMVKLLKNSEFGDDFSFRKRKKVNIIASTHSNMFNYLADPSYYRHYDYEVIKQRFVNYQNDYIKHLFFDLAPLITIPLYQQTKSIDYIYDNSFTSNFTRYDSEMVCNGFRNDEFRPRGCDTQYIIKTSPNGKENGFDRVHVFSSGFHEVPQTDYVQKWGGDGKYHTIPVHWIRYDEVFGEGDALVGANDLTYNEFNNKFKGQFDDEIISKGFIMGQYLSNPDDFKNITDKLKKMMDK